MHAFLASFSMVAIAEIGDKTQLLSFVLATRFRGQQWALIAGIFTATIINHLFAAWAGSWVAAQVSPDVLRWVLGVSFLGFAGWALIPDTLGEDESNRKTPYGAFLTTVVLFFLAEMGDKTQLATIALGARYAGDLLFVAAGTTLGMMAANVPAVLLGERLAKIFPLSKMRFVAAALFAVFGLLILFKFDFGLGLGF